VQRFLVEVAQSDGLYVLLFFEPHVLNRLSEIAEVSQNFPACDQDLVVIACHAKLPSRSCEVALEAVGANSPS
jgi:hypothetical protein